MIRLIARSFSRIALLVLCAASAAGIGQPETARPAPRAIVVTRTYYPEARMRKMHLVRPDLILYPIFYDVYC